MSGKWPWTVEWILTVKKALKSETLAGTDSKLKIKEDRAMRNIYIAVFFLSTMLSSYANNEWQARYGKE